jgi:hypothetical protein
MPKTYKVGIVVEYTPDMYNYLEWEDEYNNEDEHNQTRTEDELIHKLKSEVEEIIWNATKRNELWHSIDLIEVVND